MNNDGLKQRFLDIIKKQENRFFKCKCWNGHNTYLTIRAISQKEKKQLHHFFGTVLNLHEECRDGDFMSDESINMVDFGLTDEGEVFVDWSLWRLIISNGERQKQSLTTIDFLDFLRRDYVLFQAFYDIWKKGHKHPLEEGVLVNIYDIKTIYSLVEFCKKRKIDCDLNDILRKDTRIVYINVSYNGLKVVNGRDDYITPIYTISELEKYIIAFENIE